MSTTTDARTADEHATGGPRNGDATRPLRVLHVAKLDPRALGGIERFVMDLADAQVARGTVVSVVACSAKVPEHAPLPVFRLRLAPTLATIIHLPIAPGFPSAVRAEIAEFAPDIVHLQWPNPLAIELARGLPRQVRLVIHWQADIDPVGASWPIRLAYAAGVRAAERALLRRADAVITTSPGYADASEPLRAIARARLHVVPLALGPDRVEPARVSWPIAAARRVLFIGRLVPYKSLDTLIDAVAREPALGLVVIGDGPERWRWTARAARSAAARRIVFAGSVSEAEKWGWLEAAEVLCLPSSNRLEAFGMVLLEAAKANRPVVATDIAGSGVGWVARHLLGGRVAPVGDAAALAAVLAEAPPPAPDHRDVPTIADIAARIEAIYRG